MYFKFALISNTKIDRYNPTIFKRVKFGDKKA